MYYNFICNKCGVDKNYVIVEENLLNNIKINNLIPDYVLY